jgi:hypothetical protein
MAIIFPQNPPKVTIHLLPKEADFISYLVQGGEYLTLRAWMPAGISSVELRKSSTDQNNSFYEYNCDGCYRNCESFLEEYRDEDTEEIDYDHPYLQRHCHVFEEGYYGQYCPEGNEIDFDETFEFDISNMVFEVRLPYLRNEERFLVEATNAHLRAGKYNQEENVIYSTYGYQAANVHASYLGSHLGEVCWGNNSYPENLRECAFIYYNSRFNNDLLPLSQFQEHSSHLFNKRGDDYHYNEDGHQYLCKGADALILIDAESDIQAFFTMLSAGFKPIPDAPHIMMLPVKEVNLEKNGGVFFGFETEKDSVGLSWFISSQGPILGQIDNTFHRVGEVVASL